MAIAHEENLEGGTTDGSDVTLSSWTPSSNDLVIVAVEVRTASLLSVSVTGNGLTFVEIYRSMNERNRFMYAAYRALGASPSTGAITVSVTGASQTVTVQASRFSGCDTSGSNGSGAVEATNEDAGPSSEDDDAQISVTTISDDARVLGIIYTREGAEYSLQSGEVAINLDFTNGSGTSEHNLSLCYEDKASPGSVTIGANGSLSQNADWSTGALSLKPAAAASGGSNPSRLTLLGVG